MPTGLFGKPEPRNVVKFYGPADDAAMASELFTEWAGTIATMAVVPLSEDGRFCVYRSTAVHSIVDVVAYLGAAGERLWYEPSVPTRVTDTRQHGSCSPLLECHDGPVPSHQRQVVPTSDTEARIANVAVVDGRGPGFAQAGQCDSVGEGRAFSAGGGRVREEPGKVDYGSTLGDADPNGFAGGEPFTRGGSAHQAGGTGIGNDGDAILSPNTRRSSSAVVFVSSMVSCRIAAAMISASWTSPSTANICASAIGWLM